MCESERTGASREWGERGQEGDEWDELTGSRSFVPPFKLAGDQGEFTEHKPFSDRMVTSW